MSASARTYEAPGPGTWTLDGAHCARPRSRYLNELFGATYARGFRAGFERYGAMLDTIEYASVNGFAYTSVRPLGAPPGAKGPPPRFVLAILSRLHPVLRRRIRRAREVLGERPWREDLRQFDEHAPSLERDLLAIGDEPIARASLDELLDHLAKLDAMARAGMLEHFGRGAGGMLPVGDFLAHAVAWTGCEPGEALALLRGSSPESLDGASEFAAARLAIEDDPEAQALLSGEGTAGDKLAALRALAGATGEAVTRWLERVGPRIVTGHDIAERTAIELPESLLASLAVRAPAAPIASDAGARLQALRARVPEERRAELDALLEEARAVYRLRDARCIHDFWRLGLLRRAVLEAGRRLVQAGLLERADHAVDLTQAEIVALLRKGEGPTAAETAAHAAWRASASVHDAPAVLGPPPAPPPGADWLPAPAARIQRAMMAYVAAMSTESSRESDAVVVRGLGASPGRYTGTARLVLDASDFARVRAGDVLVAWITTPTYNVILPLLGALVTDRGGLLSHPAIVSREFGIPAVVGCLTATRRIRDGARVEVDGERGTVTVLS